MRLLVLTQKVDKEDPILGFFHNWLTKLSSRFESVVVICLEKGEYDLPNNVRVLSLGKESKAKSYKLKAVYNFYKYIWQERKNYDAVFVHMNQEYVLLGWKLWKLLGKKIYMWRNHKKGSFLTRLAVFVSTKVFYTSSESYTARFKKAVQMPVGIDTELFKLRAESFKLKAEKNKILFLGRIAPVKNVDLFVDTLKILKDRGVDFEASIYGDALEKDQEYFDDIKKKAEGAAGFFPSVPNYKTPEIYGNHQIYVNLTPSGSFDKTILEAVSCGCIPVVINTALREAFGPNMVVESSAEDVAKKIEYWLNADENIKEEWRVKLSNYVLENHSLNALMDKLCIIIRK